MESPSFFISDLKREANFTFRYVVMSVVKVTPRDHLEVKLVTVAE